MKKIFVLAVFCCVLSHGAFSMELELTGGLGNFTFDSSRTLALSAVNGSFNALISPLALVRFSGETKAFGYNAGFERDPLQRNRLFANFRMGNDYFFVQAGPFFGIANSAALPVNPGVSALFGLAEPGIIFFTAGGSSTLGIINMDKAARNTQYTGELTLGFWVPFVICSLNAEASHFSVREDDTLLTADESLRYFFAAHVHSKSVPFTVKVDIGYQSLRRLYTERTVNGDDIASNTAKDELRSVFVGMEAVFTVTPSLKLLFGGEMPVVSWGVPPMKNPSDETTFFEVRAGLIWTFGRQIP